ncbi:ATP-binding protein [Cohnella thermotolerans]|uniref:ATP-binding protein n=1 Tax=Cohnella thermotolerans TaxID=329858 RepID=UPI00040C72F3|nr:ATP-binding protein [Cohnella thermotolerans]
MKIKTKLLLGFAVLLALLVGITAFGYDRLSRMNDRLGHFYDHRFVKVRDVIDLRATVDTSGRSVNDVLVGALESDTLSVAELKRQLSTFRTQLEKLSGRSNDPEEQQLVDQVNRDGERYGDFLERFVVLVEQGNRDGAFELYKSLGRSRQDNVTGSLRSLVTYEQKTMEQEMEQTRSMYSQSVRWVAVLTVIGLLIGLGVIQWVIPSITRGLNLLTLMANKFVQGRLRGFRRLEIRSTDELGELAQVFKQIALDLQSKNEREALYNLVKEQQSWTDAMMARTTELLRDYNDLNGVAQAFIDEFAPVLGAAYGAVYLLDDSPSAPNLLTRYGVYASSGSDAPAAFGIGEGLIGQCALRGEPMTIDSLPPGYVKIRSGLGEQEPSQLVLQPIKADGRTIGVVELAYFQPIGELQRGLLERLGEKFAYIAMNIQSRCRVEELLRESQAMTEELQAQSEELISRQEELRETNEKLELHAGRLKRSEERLQRQQEELEHTNQELTVKTMALEEQNRQAERQNREIAQANAALERQAMQLTLASQYKSEFLANMSHELRTPLNSLIILSQILADNHEGNLTDKQLDYIQTIYSSGNDLLKMIDEILDLAKVDAGKMEITPEQTLIEDITVDLEHMYRSIAEEKGVAFSIAAEEDAPPVMFTDGYRLKQILRNLLSNAVKFTSEGFIALRIRRYEGEIPDGAPAAGGSYVAFEVEDTGIGIPEDKKEVIFEAFRQADGTTSRKFGGTGLGLTISRELAQLLGGWITLSSEPGKGSRFTLVLPENCPLPGEEADKFPEVPQTIGYREEEAAPHEMAPAYAPAVPGMFGGEDEADAMAEAPEEKAGEGRRGARPGAGEAAWAGKTVLLVDDDVRNVFSLSSLLNRHRIRVYTAENGKEAIELLESGIDVDLVLMDIMMPEMDGYEAMSRIRGDSRWSELPIIALTAKAMKDDRAKCLEAGASDYLAKPVIIDQLLSLLKVWLSR